MSDIYLYLFEYMAGGFFTISDSAAPERKARDEKSSRAFCRLSSYPDMEGEAVSGACSSGAVSEDAGSPPRSPSSPEDGTGAAAVSAPIPSGGEKGDCIGTAGVPSGIAGERPERV